MARRPEPGRLLFARTLHPRTTAQTQSVSLNSYARSSFASETGCLTVPMPLQRELNQAVQQLRIRESALLPHLRKHADGCESRHCINFVDVDRPGFGFHQEIHASHS